MTRHLSGQGVTHEMLVAFSEKNTGSMKGGAYADVSIETADCVLKHVCARSHFLAFNTHLELPGRTYYGQFQCKKWPTLPQCVQVHTLAAWLKVKMSAREQGKTFSKDEIDTLLRQDGSHLMEGFEGSKRNFSPGFVCLETNLLNTTRTACLVAACHKVRAEGGVESVETCSLVHPENRCRWWLPEYGAMPPVSNIVVSESGSNRTRVVPIDADEEAPRKRAKAAGKPAATAAEVKAKLVNAFALYRTDGIDTKIKSGRATFISDNAKALFKLEPTSCIVDENGKLAAVASAKALWIAAAKPAHVPGAPGAPK